MRQKNYIAKAKDTQLIFGRVSFFYLKDCRLMRQPLDYDEKSTFHGADMPLDYIFLIVIGDIKDFLLRKKVFAKN